MSTKHKTQPTDSKNESAPKKMTFDDDTQNNNDIDGTSKGKEQTARTVCANKLPDEILKRFHSEPGKLLIAGNVAWDRKGSPPQREELLIFNRFTDEKYRGIFSGPTSTHSVLINEDYKAFSFGRNHSGQCGHNELRAYSKPELIEGLKHVNVIQAACGHNHTLFLTDTGAVFACGDFTKGQLGIRKNSKRTIIQTPTRINYSGPPICKIGCGGEFSVLLDIDGNLHTFGHPEFGQLGHTTDGQHFNDRNKLVFDIQYSPKRVVSFIEKDKQGRPTPVPNVKIIDFACGKNHTIAIDSEKRAFSFGFGGYGRLGHNDTKDEWMPRLIKYLNVKMTGGAIRVFCGSAYSLAISGHNNPYIFGKNKNTSGAEAYLYPKVVDMICGLKLKCIACSVTSMILVCDDGKLIAWGASPTYGELGIGSDPKSSSNPSFIDSINGVDVSKVAMGMEHTLLLVNTDDGTSNEKYLSQPEYAPAAEETSK